MATNNNSELSHLKQALYIIEKLETKCQTQEQEKKEPIAVIGMGCRFPGGADTPEKFWHVLQQPTDVIKEIPHSRWDANAYYHPNLDAPGKIYARAAGFLEQVDQFDAQFFGISPREAKHLDPQQRILLEVAWEALESAGQPLSELSESQTGVYIGVSTNDYAKKIDQNNRLDEIDAYFATGNSLNATAGRLAYFFGFQGPTMAIDTACSSSLVAVHLACQSLRNKESNMALAGGVNLILSPENSIALSRIHALSPTDHCKTFDKEADGYVRGEGCGVVVLKRLSDALKENDPILAVILGSAVNQDGHSSGLTVPNGLSQQKLIKQALLNAQISSDRIDYVEAHGTGTPLGDPIEVRSLGAVFKKEQSANQSLYIGSVKANVGHLEAAAGIAGLIKVILALKNESIPRQLNFKEPNPYIPWDELRFKIPTEEISWLKKEKPRCAGVSGFSFTGTNAHLIASEAPESKKEGKQIEPPQSSHLLVISGKTEEALGENISRFHDYLKLNVRDSIKDICYTASVCRNHFPYRLAIVGRTKEEFCSKLEQMIKKEIPTHSFFSEKQDHSDVRIAFVFNGYPKEFITKGRQLYETYALFQEIVDYCDQWLMAQGQFSVRNTLYFESSNNKLINKTFSSDLILFVLEYALSALWKSWGIEPDVVLGAGVGEYVAGCVAGDFPLEEALRLLVTQTKLTNSLRPLEKSDVSIVIELGSGERPKLIQGVPKSICCWESEESGFEPLAESIAQLYVSGLTINWKNYYGKGPYKKLRLPTYAFQRETFWPEYKTSTFENTPIDGNQHPLLGKRFLFSFSEVICFETQLSAVSPPFLKDHRLFNTLVVPAASHLSALVLAAAQTFPAQQCCFADVFFPEALTISDHDRYTVQLAMTATSENQAARSFQINSLNQQKDSHEMHSWTSHAVGKCTLHPLQIQSVEPFDLIRLQNGRRWDHDEVYSTLMELGYNLGNTFRWIESVWVLEEELLCKLKAPSFIAEAAEYPIHPGLLDSCFQLLACSQFEDQDKVVQDFYLPFSIKKFQFYKQLANSSEIWCHMKVQSSVEGEQAILSADFQLYDENREVIVEVIGFQARKANPEALLSNLQLKSDQDLYQMTWSIQPEKANKSLARKEELQYWLVFVDNREVADMLAKRLETLHIHCMFVLASSSDQQSIVNEKPYFYINPEDPTHFQQVVSVAFLQENITCQHAVFLWSLEEQEDKGLLNAKLLLDAQKTGCMSVIHLVNALIQANWKKIPQLWLFTRGCQQIDEGELGIALKFAPLWGLRNVIATEHSELRPICIDLDPANSDLQQIVDVILLPVEETHLAFRNKLLYVARLKSFSENSATAEKVSIDKKGSYLITGGLGGIGLQVVQRLFALGAQSLILLSRSDPSPDAEKILRELQQKGANILLLKLDVSNFEQLKEGFLEIETKMPPLKGVIHAAGILKDRFLVNETWENFYQVMAPKILGGYHLHTLTQHKKLDFFICFSSIAAVLGSIGQGAYAAANMFLNTLISHRQSLGLPGLSINWGLWSEFGMAAKLENRQIDRLKNYGLGFISPQTGLQILENSLNLHEAQLIVLPINWAKFLKHFDEKTSSFFNFQKPLNTVEGVTSTAFVQRLNHISMEERPLLLLERVCAMLATVLQLPSGELIDVNRGFFDLGLDSLMALELKEKIEQDLGIIFPSTLIFNYPNTRELVDYLMKKITAIDLSNAEVMNRRSDLLDSMTAPSEVEQLSNDEVTQILLEKLK